MVKDIFSWFLYGIEKPGGEKNGSLSINGIAKELNERGIPCPAAYKKEQGFNYKNPHNRYKDCYWSGPTVSRMLKDRVYTGCMIQGKYRIISYKIHKQIKTPEDEWFIVENTHEALIEVAMFEEVQRRLERDTRTPSHYIQWYFQVFCNVRTAEGQCTAKPQKIMCITIAGRTSYPKESVPREQFGLILLNGLY